MKQLLLITAAFIIGVAADATPMKTIDLTKKFRDQDIEAHDGSYKIIVPTTDGQWPKIVVEESLATCKLTRGPKTEKTLTLFLEMETETDDGMNGCTLTFVKGRQKTTISFGYFIDG